MELTDNFTAITLFKIFKKGFKNSFLKKSVSYLFFANLSGAIFGFLTVIVLTHVLPVEEYGKYSYILYILLFFNFLSLPGMATAIMQSAANNYDKVLESGIRSRMKFSILGSLCILVIAGFYFLRSQIDIFTGLLFGALLFPFYICLNSYLYFLNGKRLYSKYFKFFLTEDISTFIITILIALLTRNFLITILGNIITKIIINWILYVKTLKFFKKNEFDDPEAKKVGRHLSIISVIGALGNNFDKIIIGTFISLSSLAIFGIADMIANQMKLFWVTIDSYIFPVIAIEEKYVARKRVLQRIATICPILIFIALIGIICVKLFIPLFFTSRYNESIPFAQLLIVAFVISSPGAVLSTYFRAQKMIKKTYVLKIVESISYLIALLFFVPRYAAIGVVWARMTANASYTLTSISLFFSKNCRALLVDVCTGIKNIANY